MNNPIQPTLSDPQLIDNTLSGINTALLANLSWLDNAYTKAQKLTKEIDGKKYNYPAVHVTGALDREYLDLFPDEHKGNFSFWDASDGERAKWNPNEYYFLTADIGLIVWGNIENVYPSTFQTKSIENIKREVLDVLSTVHISGGRFSVSRVYMEAQNIYKGYDHREIDNQFLMLPYFGFKIEGELIIKVVCAELEPI